MTIQTKTLQTTSIHQDRRIDVIVQEMTGRPKSVIRGMFNNNCVKVDGMACDDPGLKVTSGQEISLRYDAETRYKEKPKSTKSRMFDLIYDDADIIIVNKKPGFLSSPSTPHEKDHTLLDAVSHHVNRGQSRGRPVGLIHRLDRDTSGLLIFGKNPQATSKIKDQFEARKPERIYVAIVAGVLKDERGTFQSYLATDKDLNQRSVKESEGGKIAITHYQVVRIFKDSTLVHVTLETGRRNQIRVHFSEIGHPILGDQRYNTIKAQHRHWKHKRLALHAWTLGVKHPTSGKALSFTAPVPAEFENFYSAQEKSPQ